MIILRFYVCLVGPLLIYDCMNLDTLIIRSVTIIEFTYFFKLKVCNYYFELLFSTITNMIFLVVLLLMYD